MGFFEFIKDAGAKVFAHEPEPAPAAHAAPETNPLAEQFRQRRQAALLKLVSDLQLEVEGLRVELEGDRVTVFGKVASQAEREKVVLALGNVHGVAGVDDRLEVAAAAPEAQFYTVEKGDTLSKIARHYYGNANKYPVIFEANRPMLSDPDKIYPGQVLRIPPA
ncbi:MAG: peptidoglycan-binding protein LysM [Thermoanaerobaculia bacterium]